MSEIAKSGTSSGAEQFSDPLGQTESETSESRVEIARRKAAEMIQRELLNPLVRDRLSALQDENSPLHHTETYDHVAHMAVDAVISAELYEGPIELTPEDLEQFAQAALLHDVGKLDAEIMPLVQKPGLLSPDEDAVVARHPEKSFEMIYDDFSDKPLLLALVLFHHQIEEVPTFSQTDFEAKLNELHLSAEEFRKFEVLHPILEAADKFEACTAERSYRPKPLSDLKVAEILFNKFVMSGHDIKAVHAILHEQFPHKIFECNVIHDENGKPRAEVTEIIADAS